MIADPNTGKVEKVVAAHDVGKAVNPALCEGQIEGSVHMGLGYALTEDFPCDTESRPTNMTLRSLGIIRAKDMPEVEVILVEVPPARLTVRDQGSGRDRLGAHRRSGGRRIAPGGWRVAQPTALQQALPIGTKALT